MPLAEISGDAPLCDRAAGVVTSIGMHPLVLRKEIDAFIGNRFQEAVWREALWMLKDGIATTTEIDDAIRMSFGLRWAQMGLFETYRIAGGEAGMRLLSRAIEAYEAALETGCLRLRPVLLTAITTVLGLMPMVLGVNVDLITPSLGLGAPSTQWWTQLSSAIAGGLAFATVLTLLLTPSLLVLGNRAGQAFGRLTSRFRSA